MPPDHEYSEPLNPEASGQNESADDAGHTGDTKRGEPTANTIPGASSPCVPPTITHQHITYRPEKDWWDKARPFVEIAGAILLFVYTAYTIRMYSANKEAADAATSAAETARKTLEIDQRAWVSAIAISGELVVDKPFIITVQIHNAGKTFAKKMVVVDAIEPILEGGSPDFERESKEIPLSISLLAPGGDLLTPLKATAQREKLTVEDLRALREDVRSGRTRLFIHGRITYEDIFKCPHWTTFCYRLSKDFTYQTCNTHNDADDSTCPN